MPNIVEAMLHFKMSFSLYSSSKSVLYSVLIFNYETLVFSFQALSGSELNIFYLIVHLALNFLPCLLKMFPDFQHTSLSSSSSVGV